MFNLMPFKMLKGFFNCFICAAFVISLCGYKNAQAQIDFSTTCDVVDVALVIDSSENIGEANFENLREFLKIFFSVINVGQTSARVAAVQVGAEASTIWTLSESVNSAELVSRTDEMDYFGGEQQIASAFTQLSTDIFTLENGDRAAVPDVVVIFTGGSAPESSDGMAELRRLGAHVVVVTVGEDASLKWKKFASAPPEDNFFSLESAFHVVLLLQDPTFVLCTEEETVPPTAPPTTTTVISTTTEERISPKLFTTTNSAITTKEMVPPPTDQTSITATDPTSHLCPHGSWTRWFNNDTPDGEGDDESLHSIRAQFPGEVCEFPIEFQARIAVTGVEVDSNANNVLANRLTGLECLNIFGPRDCDDYEIRFCCPQAVTTPPPSIIDTTPSDNRKFTSAATDASPTPSLRPTIQPQTQEPIPESKPSPSCPNGAWTTWYNNDTPLGDGDDETLQSIRSRYPGDICDFPTDFETRNAATGIRFDGNADNVIATRLLGLECLNGYGMDCEDYEIRFCCPRRIRCFVGSTSSTSDGSASKNLQELECSPGDVCSDVTAKVVTYDDKNITSINSFGLCMSPSKCATFQCDSARSLMSSDVIDVLSCEAKCCEDDLCNRPINSQVPTPEEVDFEEESSYDQGTVCYKGIEVEGVPDPSMLGFTNLGLRRVQCELGEVCSNMVATAFVPGGPKLGATIRQFQCLAPVACDSSSCDFINSILPDKHGVKLLDCSTKCCDWNGCNAPAVMTSTSRPGNIFKTLATKKPAENSKGSNSKFVSTPSKAVDRLYPTTQKLQPTPYNPFRTKYDEEFLPSCTITQAMRSMLWCESLFSQPQPYEGLETCRNKLKEVARCVAKQMRWCLTGNKFNKLDSFKFKSFNTQTIMNFLNEAGWSEDSEFNEEIDSFCFHAGYDFQFSKPVSGRLEGCHYKFLTELRDRAKSFYYTFTWARRKEDICRAQTSFKRWFIEATTSRCNFDRLTKQGYSVLAAQYLDNLVRVALREIKNHESLSCTDVSRISG